MMTTNGRTARDIALDGLPPEQRLKLLELAETHGIPSDDSLYWMAIILKPESPQPLDLTPVQQMLKHQMFQQQDLQHQVDRGFDLMAEAMEHFRQQIVELETKVLTLQQTHRGGWAVSAVGNEMGNEAQAREEPVEQTELEDEEDEVDLLPPPRAVFRFHADWSRTSWATLGVLTVAGTLLCTTALMSGFRFAQTVQPSSVTPNAMNQQGEKPDSRSSVQEDSTGVSLPSELSKANQERLKRCIADGNTKCTFLIEAP